MMSSVRDKITQDERLISQARHIQRKADLTEFLKEAKQIEDVLHSFLLSGLIKKYEAELKELEK